MKIARHIAGAYVEVWRPGQQPIYKLAINGAHKGTFQLDNTQGVLAMIEAVLKVNPKQKEMAI